MPGKSTWTVEADRDLLVAMAMSDGGSKPSPKWENVQAIMAKWGYDFSASAMYQHFSHRIWKQIVEKRGEGTPAKPAKFSPTSTPRKRIKKQPKASEAPVGSDTDLCESPKKKRKTPAKNGHKKEEDDDDRTPVKKETGISI